MYKVIEINSFEEAIKHLFIDSHSNKIKRIRSSYVFRGMCNSDYTLQTSLYRNCKDNINLEKSILRNFTKYAQLEHPELTSSIWRQMILGQHHGLPTRLLDWSYSPLVALHFSTDDKELNRLDMQDGAVWKVNLTEINELLPNKYKKKLNDNEAYILTVDMLNEIVTDLSSYDNDMRDKSFAFLEPPSIDSRIINQYSLFSVIPNSISNLEVFLEKNTIKSSKLIINKNIKWDIRDMLDQMNMNERIVYPGLDGLATWLKRHYFIRGIDNVKF